MSDSASLNFEGKEIKLPIITGSENEKAIDISKLRSETGLVTLDKGFKNTGSTTSNITYLDGEKGILRHRGYSIEELASKSTFTEVCYLLIYGNLPTKSELDSFEHCQAYVTENAPTIRAQMLLEFNGDNIDTIYCFREDKLKRFLEVNSKAGKTEI